jgi:acyl carrier protein
MWNPLQKKSIRDELMSMLKNSIPRAKTTVKITDETELRELGIDSLGLVMLVVGFCERFGFDPTTLGNNADAIRKVKDLLDVGAQMLSAQEAGSMKASIAGVLE